MKKLMLAAITVLALGGAGLAVAKSGGGSVAAVSATFTATTVSQSHQTTCTTSDGKALEFTNATYSGTVAGDPSLAGAVTIQSRSTIDTTAGLGVVRGTVRFGSSKGSQAQFTAVYDHGAIAGLAVGHAGRPHVTLVGNLSAAFSATGGFTSGKIGGSAGGSAVTLGAGKCSPSGSKGSEDDGKDKGAHQRSSHGTK